MHGPFKRSMPHIGRVESGDRITAWAPDAGWSEVVQPDPYAQPPVKMKEITDQQRQGHALIGPLFVTGAEPGDALEIRLETIRPGGWGWTSAGGWPSEFNQRLGLDDVEHYRMHWRIENGQAVDANGRTVSLSPFLGWIGLMPAEDGLLSTTPPRRTGGNLDCRELVAGTSLFLPVEVNGAYLSFGDGHAVQGDGEVAGPALECPMRVEMTVILHKASAPTLPYAHTPAGWVTLGFSPNLDDAMYAALAGLVDRVSTALNISRQEALMLCSLKASLRITQIVNETKGVHALFPTEALRELGIPF